MQCRRQTWPLCVREQAASCCLPLSLKGKLCVLSHPWDRHFLSPHSWNFFFNLHRCTTFLITQTKYLPLWIKNVIQITVSSVQPFLFSFLPLLLHFVIFSQRFLANVLIFNNTWSNKLLTTVINFKNELIQRSHMIKKFLFAQNRYHKNWGLFCEVSCSSSEQSSLCTMYL